MSNGNIYIQLLDYKYDFKCKPCYGQNLASLSCKRPFLKYNLKTVISMLVVILVAVIIIKIEIGHNSWIIKTKPVLEIALNLYMRSFAAGLWLDAYKKYLFHWPSSIIDCIKRPTIKQSAQSGWRFLNSIWNRLNLYLSF